MIVLKIRIFVTSPFVFRLRAPFMTTVDFSMLFLFVFLAPQLLCAPLPIKVRAIKFCIN